MSQLVELGKSKEAFAEAGAEVIAVFREEKEGEAGLAKIKKKTQTTFTLALDTGKEQTARYSAGEREFTGYVINSQGVIADVFKGDLKNRAKCSDSKGSESEGSGDKGSSSKASEPAESDSKGSADKGPATKPDGSSTK